MSLVHENGPRAGPAQRPEARGRPGPGSPAVLQALQRGAGNAAVSAYVQRLAENPRPVTSTAVSPQNDPRFQAVAAKVAGQGRRLRQHPPPRAEAKQAADAAAPPATDKEAQAKASRADTMSTAKPAGFDKAGFIAAVKKAIAAQAPKNLDQAENFEESGKAEAVKAEVSGKVTEGKKASAQDIAEKTAAAPDTSKVAEKPVTPLRPEPQPTAPRLNTAAAMPAPVPAAQTDLSGGQRETDAAMADAGVTEQQLATSNEPEFTDALTAKKEGEEHSATAPAAFRETEAAQLGDAKQNAQEAGAAGLAGMLETKKSTLSGAAAGKTAAKTQEESERARIASQIKAVFDATKTDVDAILGGLDAKVDQEFAAGEAEVRKAFTADLDARMEAYKDKRYSGLEGKGRWLKDKFAELPGEANECYTEARALYERDMDVLISRVADLIGTQLTAAKDRIAKGREDIKAYVEAQPKNLKKLAQQAAGEFASQFDQLESDVDAKKDALVDDLATKYSESKAAVEEEITAMQEENKGLWSKAKAAVGGAIQTITQLKDLLTSALARAAGAIDKIVKDPIGFLGKFVNAVKGGIVRFGENIAEHLKAGLQGWLLCSLSAAGVQLPAKFDLRGIIGLVLSLLGLTWPAIRARIAKHVPEEVMSGVEKSVAFIQVVLSEGVGGLWKWVVGKLGDIKEMVMGQIREFVITKIVKAGITWLISMLNPAAAFIKACKMLYDVVMFFVEKAAQIKEFVDSILDSVESIADGGVGAVAGYIEKTLARTVPVLLGFLASLLGLGGISEKIKEIIAKVQKPVGQVVDKLVAGAVKIGKKMVKKLSGAFQKGKAWAKDQYERGKTWGKRRLGIAQHPEDRDEKASPKAKERIARKAANSTLSSIKKVALGQIPETLASIKAQWAPRGVKSISLTPSGAHAFRVEATVNPTVGSEKLGTLDIDPTELLEPEPLKMEAVTATSFKSQRTSATGKFRADITSNLTGTMTSGAPKAVLEISDSQPGAHAEEQIVNNFQRQWKAHSDKIKDAKIAFFRNRPKDWYKNKEWFRDRNPGSKDPEAEDPAWAKNHQARAKSVQMIIHVSRSSCINCAAYIARFVTMLRRKSLQLSAHMKFASLYQGRQEVPQSTMNEFADSLQILRNKAKLKETSRLGRLWGLMSLRGNKKEEVAQVSGGRDAGKAGLAILKRAGIQIEILSENDIEGGAGSATLAVQRKILEGRNARLKKALDEVEKEISVTK